MYKSTDFNLDSKEFRFKKDSYPLSKINNVRVKKLSFLDNLGIFTHHHFNFSTFSPENTRS